MRLYVRFLARAPLLLVLAALAVMTAGADAQATVAAAWRGAPPRAPLGEDVALALRLVAAEDAPEVVVTILPTDGVAVLEGERKWSGSLTKGQILDLPFTIRIVADGDWTLGASVTARRPDADQVSGAILRVRARDGVATLTSETADNF